MSAAEPIPEVLPTPPKRRRFRWLRRLAFLTLLLVCAARATQRWWLEPLAARLAKDAGLELAWNDLDLTLWRGALELRGLDVKFAAETDAEGRELQAAPLFSADYFAADVDLLALWSGELRLTRVALGHAQLDLKRDAAGRWDFERLGGDSEALPEETAAEEPGPVDLSLPLVIERLDLATLGVHFADASTGLDQRATLGITLRDLGREDAPGMLELELVAPGWFEALRLDGELTFRPEELLVDLQTQLLDLSPKRTCELAAALGVEGLTPLAKEVDARFHLRLAGTVEAPEVQLAGGAAATPEWAAALTGLDLSADGVQALGLADLRAELHGYELGLVTASDLDLYAARGPDEDLRVAGFSLSMAPRALAEPATESAAEDTPVVTQEDPSAVVEAEPESPDEAPAMVAVGPFEVRGIRVHWQDHSDSLATPVTLELALMSLASGKVELGSGIPVPLELELSAPGIFESAVVRGLMTKGQEETVEVELEVRGLAPKALEPYLSAAGIESDLRAGSFTLAATARRYGPRGDRRLDATLRELALVDGETLVGVDAVRLIGLELESGDLVLESLVVDGPAAAATRRADGSLELAGLRFLPSGHDAKAIPVAVAPAVTPNVPPAPRRERRLSIGRISVGGVQLNLRDEAVSPALAMLPEKLDLLLEGLVLGDPTAPPATLHLELSQAGLAESLTIDASLDLLAPRGLQLDAVLTGRGLSTALVEPYLIATGIEGALMDGRLDLGLHAAFRPVSPGAASWSLAFHDFALAAGEVSLASAAEISATVLLDPLGTSVSKVLVASPEFGVERRADGLWSFGGLAWVGPKEAPSAAPTEPAVVQAPSAQGPAPGAPVQLGGLVLREGLVHVWDHAAPGEPRFELYADAEIGRVDLGRPLAGATTSNTPVELSLRVPGVVEELGMTAELRVEPKHPLFSGSLRLDGIHGPALAPYMPPGVELELDAGSLALGFSAEGEADVGGVMGEWSLRAEALDLTLVDGAEPLFRMTRLGFDAPRLSKRAVQVDELTLEGTRLNARRDAEGVLHVLGLALAPAAPESNGATPPPANGNGGSTPTLDTGQPLTKPVRPFLGLEVLRLELAHFGFLDESGPGKVPFDLSLTLENSEPWSADLAGEEDALLPLRLRLTGQALPVAEALSLELALAPFLSEPHLELNLLVSGLSGAGLAGAFPGLAATLDAGAMEGGSFAGSLLGDIAVARRGPFGLDLARGVSGELELTDVAFRLTPDAPVELGFSALAFEIRKASAAGIELATLELNDPVGRIEILPAGLAIGGLVLLTPEAPVVVPVEAPAPAADGVLADPVAVSPGPYFDISVSEVYASGLDFVFRDTTADPPVVLPLKDLDLSINGFTTRALREPLPIRFELFLGAGVAELPERVEAANLFTGLFGAAASIVTGGNDKFKTQMRPVFGSVDASGRLTLFPAPTGWLSLSVASLELPVFRGAARKGGVDLGDGLLNLDVGVRLLGERGAAVSTKARAAYLSLSEPPGGPISTYLKLPAPLDSVLFLLRDENGDVVLPLDFSVGADGGTKGLGTEIAKTIGLVVGEAVASSPLRIVGGVLDMTGLMRDKPIVLPEQPERALFLPGSTELVGSGEAALKATFKLLRKNRELELDLVHGFGAEDLLVLGTRANPSPEACRALALRLGVERDLLIAAREDKSTDLRARFAAGDNQDLDAGREQLLELDGELARTEEALDTLLSLLRPGAERRAKRRTKAAAMLLAEARLEFVRALIAAQPIESIGQRLRVRRARFSEPDPQTPGGSVFVVPR